jgi:hypothetical protein
MKDLIAKLASFETPAKAVLTEGSGSKEKQKTPYKTMDQHKEAGKAYGAKVDADKKAKDAEKIGKKVNESEGSKYGVFQSGGSVGEKNDAPKKTFDTREEAAEYAKRRNKQLTPGEKGYYKMKYSVRAIKESEEQVNEMWGDSDHAPDKMGKRDEKKYVDKLKARNTNKKSSSDTKTFNKEKRSSTPQSESVAESKVPRKLQVIAEGVSFKVSSPHLAKVLRRFPHELAIFNTEGELDDDLYHALFDHYTDEGEMPYGVAKARDGDPYNWISDHLYKDLTGSDSGHPALQGVGEAVVDEAPMNPFQQQRSNSMLNKSKDDAWAAAKAKVDAGGKANPFQTPAQQNPAFGGGGDRAGQARHGAGVWSGNFEGVGEGAAGDIMEIDDEDDGDDWYDAQGNSDPSGAYDAGGHYDGERGAAAGDDYRDRMRDMDEDSVEHDETNVITEGMEGVITEVLTNVGLDHGLDFFFDHGLVVIGKSTARVAMNALQADSRITSSPTISQCDGEECHIEFNAGGEPELDEALSGAQKWRMAQMQGDTYQTGEKQMGLDKEYANFMKLGDKASAAAVKQKMSQLAAQRMKGAHPPVEEGLADDFMDMAKGMKNKDGTPRFPNVRQGPALRKPESAPRPPATGPAPDLHGKDGWNDQERGYGHGRYMGDSKQNAGKALNEDVNLNITANGEEDVLNVIRKLSGLGNGPIESNMSPLTINAKPEPTELVGTGDVGSSEMSPIIAAMDAIISGGDESTPEDDAAEEIVVGGHDHEFEEAEYANEPDPTVHTSTTAMINQGDDLNRPKKMGYPMRNPGNNPMAEARSLMRQYETMLKEIEAK